MVRSTSIRDDASVRLPLLLASTSLIACATPASAATPKTTYVIHAGKLVDVRASAVVERVTIRVEGAKIAGVKAGFVAAKSGETLVDLKDHTVLPGFMDMHTHLTGELSEKSYSERFFMNDADIALRAAQFARRTILAGFTTVRDLGDRNNVSVSLRDAIAKGWTVGPRIFTAAKSLATTGGHADPTNGLNADLKADPGPKEGVINGPDEARKAVRQRYKDGADLIKLTATGGVLSLAKSGQNPQFTKEELEAVVATAKDYGFTVAVHAHGAEGIKRALRAGVTSIEHGTYLDDEAIALMKSRGAYYVPTISAGEWVALKSKEPGFFPEVVRPKAAVIGAQIKETFAKAHAAGVKIAFGTDCGVSPHGTNAREFQYMVEAGMKPMDAIRSATIVAAELVGAKDRLGAVSEGMLADLVAVRGDPIADVKRLQDVTFVMKDGAVLKQDGRAVAP